MCSHIAEHKAQLGAVTCRQQNTNANTQLSQQCQSSCSTTEKLHSTWRKQVHVESHHAHIYTHADTCTVVRPGWLKCCLYTTNHFLLNFFRHNCSIRVIYCTSTSESAGSIGWYMPEQQSREGTYQSRYCPWTSEYEGSKTFIACTIYGDVHPKQVHLQRCRCTFYCTRLEYSSLHAVGKNNGGF